MVIGKTSQKVLVNTNQAGRFHWKGLNQQRLWGILSSTGVKYGEEAKSNGAVLEEETIATFLTPLFRNLD